MSEKIGVIVSCGYGAGWSSWGDPMSALDQELAIAIDSGEDFSSISKIAEQNWPDQYQGGLEQCRVIWVDEGVMFRIDEYDGAESIEYRDNDGWITAK